MLHKEFLLILDVTHAVIIYVCRCTASFYILYVYFLLFCHHIGYCCPASMDDVSDQKLFSAVLAGFPAETDVFLCLLEI